MLLETFGFELLLKRVSSMSGQIGSGRVSLKIIFLIFFGHGQVLGRAGQAGYAGRVRFCHS